MKSIDNDVVNGMFDARESDLKHPTYNSEMGFYNLIAEGKHDEVQARWKESLSPNAIERGILSTDPTRNAIYHFISMITVVTRLCIANGLDQDLAYKVSDTFITRVDKMADADDVLKLQEEMVLYYADLMANDNKVNIQSKQISQCIDYIHNHLHDNVTVFALSEFVKLNETYLSKLFKKQVGCTLSEYIRRKKVEEACWLLKYTDKTSVEISTDLSFSSHSYFISVFKKEVGVTPKEYRNKNFKKI